MKRFCLAVATALISVSCVVDSGDPAPDDVEDQDEVQVGSLELSLTTSDSQGRQYRLRNAEFSVSNYYYYPYGDGGAGFHTVVSTETEPDAPSINLRLVPGQYYVSLSGSWYIERLTPNGPERVEKTVLLSEAYQYAYIYHQGVSSVAFRFGVDGDLVDFRHGDLTIDVQIELPGESDYRYDASVPFPRDGGIGVDAGLSFPTEPQFIAD